MSGRLVVKRYVTALILAAEETGNLDTVKGDVETVSRILEESLIRGFCLKAGNSLGKVISFLKIAFLPYVSDFTGRFILVLGENGRIAALPFVKPVFDEILEARAGRAAIVLETPREPEAELVLLVQNKMAHRLGKTVKVIKSVVPQLLGGGRIIYQNRMIDFSVRGRLNKMRKLLKQE